MDIYASLINFYDRILESGLKLVDCALLYCVRFFLYFSRTERQCGINYVVCLIAEWIRLSFEPNAVIMQFWIVLYI